MSPAASDRSSPAKLFSSTRDGVRVRVKVAPGAADNRICGVLVDGERGAFLKVVVTAPPGAGKANAALIKLLSREWRLPKSSLAETSGANDRRKMVSIEGDALELVDYLVAWAANRESQDWG